MKAKIPMKAKKPMLPMAPPFAKKPMGPPMGPPPKGGLPMFAKGTAKKKGK